MLGHDIVSNHAANAAKQEQVLVWMRRYEDTVEDLDCWFGNVRLAFTYQEGCGSRARTRECIFVRWYDVADFTASERHL